MNYGAAHMAIAQAYSEGWSCEKVAGVLSWLGFSEAQIKRLMELGEFK